MENIPWAAISANMRGDGDERSEQTLKEWLASDEKNQIVFGELAELWNDIRFRGALIEPDMERVWKQLRTATIVRRRRRELRRNGIAWAVAAFAAASLIFGVVGYFVLPHDAPARERSGQRIKNMSGKSLITMSDGSGVWLHNNTLLSYDAGFGHKSRRVSLEGEAFFEVAHNSELPFVVGMGGLDVTVHGTKFNARYDAGSGMATIGLIEGSVSLAAAGWFRTISPGEFAVIDLNSGSLSVSNEDTYFERLWANDKLIMSNRTLGEICRYLEKWYNTTIMIDAEAAKAYSYSFTITDEPLEEVLRIMTRINPIYYRFVENQGVKISVRSE